MRHSLAVFLHSPRYDRIYQAVSLISTASSMGWKCHLFLFFGALASFMDGTWDEVNVRDRMKEERQPREKQGADDADPPWLRRLQRGLELANIPSLYDILEKSRTAPGGLTVCACSTSVRLLDITPAAVRERVDEIIGISTMLQIASEAQHVLYI